VVFIFVGIIIIGGGALSQLWVYVLGPLIESILPSVLYTYLKFEEK